MKKSECYRTAIDTIIRNANCQEKGEDATFETLQVLFNDYDLAVLQEKNSITTDKTEQGNT